MNSNEITAYKCYICGTTYINKESADNCCKPKYCENCGSELTKNRSYFTICKSCEEKQEFDKAKKYSYDEYMKLHKDDCYTLCILDNFYTDIDDLFDQLDEDDFNEIEYCNGIYKDEVNLDGDSIIEELEENSEIEDWEVDEKGRKEMIDFIDQWNKKYGTVRYNCDDGVIVLINKKLKEEYK